MWAGSVGGRGGSGRRRAQSVARRAGSGRIASGLGSNRALGVVVRGVGAADRGVGVPVSAWEGPDRSLCRVRDEVLGLNGGKIGVFGFVSVRFAGAIGVDGRGRCREMVHASDRSCPAW